MMRMLAFGVMMERKVEERSNKIALEELLGGIRWFTASDLKSVCRNLVTVGRYRLLTNFKRLLKQDVGESLM